MTEPSGGHGRTITNFDLFSPNKFKVVIEKFPATNFFAQTILIPGFSIGAIPHPTNTWADISQPGDKILFEDLVVSFLLDEDLVTQKELMDWTYGIVRGLVEPRFSDISIIALTNNSTKNKTYKFFNCYPYSTGSFSVDTKVPEDQPITLDVIFKYSHYEIAS